MDKNQENWYAWEQDTYQTGSTRPPKSRRGLIAFLLVLVIFLCGISTALGLMNIRLFKALTQTSQETEPRALSHARSEEYAEDIHFSPGFSGREIPEIWCLYQGLPQGVCITAVAEDSAAAITGFQPGDILVRLNGESVTTAAQLSGLLEQLNGQSVSVVLHRAEEQLELTLTLTQD